MCVSLVQSADGRVVDLEALRATGVRICLDATQAVASSRIDLAGVDYLVAHAYKWLLCPRGLGFLYVSPERREELGVWTAGWKARVDPYEDYYGLPDMSDEARRLDVSVPWLSAAGARRSLELLVGLGNDRIADHNLGLARSLTSSLGLPEPAAPIVRFRVENAESAAREPQRRRDRLRGARRIGPPSFHLYNDEEDVGLAVRARTGGRGHRRVGGQRLCFCRLPAP